MANLPDEQRNPYDDANEQFECVGRLYERRYHRLRPGKDEPMGGGRNSMDADNLRQFQDWIKHQAFEDAIRRINLLEARVDELEAADLIQQLSSALKPFAAAAIKGEERYAILQSAGVGVMDRCDGFIDIAKRQLSVANFRNALEALTALKETP